MQTKLGLLHARGIESQLIGRQPAVDAAGLVAGIGNRGSDDLIGRNPGDLSNPFRGVLRGALLELLKAVRPLLDEFAVVEVTRDDHVDPGHEQSRVGAGANLQPHVGHLRHFGLPRIDDDHLGLGFLSAPLLHGAPANRIRIGVVPSQQYQAVQLLDGRRQNAGNVRAGQRIGQRNLVAGTGGPGRAHVGRIAKQIQEARADGIEIRAIGSLDGGQAFGAIFGFDRLQFCGNLVQRLLPGDSLPSVLAALPLPFERIASAGRDGPATCESAACARRRPRRDCRGTPDFL